MLFRNSGWWRGNFIGVHDHPINFGLVQDKLVNSPHEYCPSVYEQTWFTSEGGSFTYDSIYKDHWKGQWMFIYEGNIAPI
jgi:aryl-phospho-beta-D-glucosidase BglC (GH1 family)